MLKRAFVALLIALLPASGWGQTVLQGGSFTAGLPNFYSSSGGSQPIIQQSATAAGGSQSIKEMSIVKRGTGTAPYAGGAGGYLGSAWCMYDGPTTGAYHQLCLDANATGGFGLLSYNSGGGASDQSLKFIVNGTSYAFPFPGTGTVTGPATSVVNDLACWNDTLGTVLKDCGTVSLTPGGSNGQIQYNNSGAFGGFTMGGDATVVTSTGAMTITKIGGQDISLASSFATSGAGGLTLTLTGATNITLPTTGTVATLAGSEALTNKTYNGNTWTAGSGTLTIANGKTFTASNTLTLTATDGSTLAIGTGGTLGTAAYTAASAYIPANVQVTNALGADVLLNNTSNYFDGPSVAQGSTGTWFACGQVTLIGGAGDAIYVKLWDGTTVISSTYVQTPAASANPQLSVTLCGYLATPAGNLRISARDTSSTSGKIVYNGTGTGKDSTISAFRVN